MQSNIIAGWMVATALLGGVAGGQIFSSPQTLKPSAAVPATGSSTPLPASKTTGVESSAAAAPSTPAQRPAKRAEVSFAAGQLTVKADNSSLNLILREIGRQTGMKITGGVTEERVFGSYGPGTPDTVLARLLDGTASNMLLIASSGPAPGELILTPRLGGPTPPNPNAKGFDDDEGGDDDAPRTPVPRGVTLFGGAQPTAPAPTTTQQPVMPPITQPVPDAAGTTAPGTQQSPNGVKTPQEIYQQLQLLRQQQQQQQQAEPPDNFD